MKKKLFIVSTLCISLLLSACGNSSTDSTVDNTKPIDINFPNITTEIKTEEITTELQTEIKTEEKSTEIITESITTEVNTESSIREAISSNPAFSMEAIRDGRFIYSGFQGDYSLNTYAMTDGSTISWVEALDLIEFPEKFTEKEYRRFVIDCYCLSYILNGQKKIDYANVLRTTFKVSDSTISNIKTIMSTMTEQEVLNSINHANYDVDIVEVYNKFVEATKTGTISGKGYSIDITKLSYDGYLFMDIVILKDPSFTISKLSDETQKTFLIDLSILMGLFDNDNGPRAIYELLGHVTLTTEEMSKCISIFKNITQEEIMSRSYILVNGG